MTMEQFSVIQLIWLFAAYFVISILLPHYTVGKALKFRNRYERFLIYTTLGNFYVINLVLMLEICHISYPVTLIGITVVLCTYVKIRLEKIPIRTRWDRFAATLRKLFGGELGTKTFVYRETGRVLSKRTAFFRHLYDVYIRHFIEVLMILLLLAILFYEYGYNAVTEFGYKASDLIVHNFWINDMNVNKVFTDGVYPFGFHCIIYFIHAVFRLDTYVCLRLMAFVQTVWFHLTLLCALMLMLKNRYSAFFGTYLYAVSGFFDLGTYSRFFASLPQEFGMIFIYPSLYFLVDYFRQQRRENRGSISGRARFMLICFALSFALTLEVHFYGTIIAGVMCIAVAAGFLFMFLRGRFFKRIMITGVLSVLIAVFPMALAFALGTPLQGSLNWGMSVIKGEKWDDGTTGTNADPVAEAPSDISSVNVVPAETGTDTPGLPEDIPVTESSGTEDTGNIRVGFDLNRIINGIKARIKELVIDSHDLIENYIFRTGDSLYVYILLAAFPALILLGMLFFLPLYRNYCYGAMVITTGFYMILMCIIISPESLKLPMLMDFNRGRVYFAYSIPLFAAVLVDALIYLLMPFKNRHFGNFVSLAGTFGLLAGLYMIGQIREPYVSKGMEMNDAIKCITNIILTDEDYKWTICSANDENQMCYDHGFHYELITFLREMEGIGSVGRINIPTQVVFFFIEKVPIDYFATYEDSGQHISEEGAENPLPWGTNLSVYQARNRWIVMSRIYEWAETFRALYPNEVNIYLETDEFVCYRVEQNPYRLFNFAIDYHYNTIDYYAESQDSDI